MTRIIWKTMENYARAQHANILASSTHIQELLFHAMTKIGYKQPDTFAQQVNKQRLQC
jgi:hypothetical protein